MDVLYSQEERNKIEETIKFIVNDLITLWENAQPEAVTIETRYLGIEYTSYLTIDKKGLTLRTYSKFYSDYDYMFGGEGSLKKRKNYPIGHKKKDKIKLGTKDNDILVPIIENYDQIRTSFLNETRKYLTGKDKKINQIDEWYNRFKKETEIEIDLPSTNNQHGLVVTNEDGKTIGTIDFGDKIIKFITKGDIKFIDKRSESVKVKQK